MGKEEQKHEKPKEILELEKVYGINILDSKEALPWDNKVYEADAKGNIIHLQLDNCEIHNISPIAALEQLIILSLRDNRIVDISPLEQLSHLKTLVLTNNKIDNIEYLPVLHEAIVDLRANNVRNISRRFAERQNWLTPYFILTDNPLEFPPISVLQLGSVTAKNYYESTEQFGHTALSKGRIIVIGDGSAGKSSLIEKILYNTFNQHKTQTNGINIEHWELTCEDDRLATFHIWDFGGQEIQHAVHKFFFTEGCLYVLVLDNRKEEEPEYWLQQIESLGAGAPVLVVFNKHDQNATETADRKYLKEKYPNIQGFFNASCLSGFGIDDFKTALKAEVMTLKTVNEQFPNNWLSIKNEIEERTSGASQHYLTYESYQEICKQNATNDEGTQKLLLRYFNTIGTVTWFGEDTHLQFLHVLNPAWITQGVYKVITAKKTARLFGQIHINDFKELLQPVNDEDYTYAEAHYSYILTMMEKFDLCYTPDDRQILIPSAFGKEPKLEYSEFRGEGIRTYILQFKDYMPLALIHRYIAKKMPNVVDGNYWYTGIVHSDSISDSLAMVHADKQAKRIYVRIKDGSQLGMWEHIRREIDEISSSYAKIPYDELVALDDNSDNTVNYEDLINHIKAEKLVYFHPKLRHDFNVGYLIGLFEDKDVTLQKFKNDKTQRLPVPPSERRRHLTVINQILNNNSPVVTNTVNNQINIDIDIQIVNNLSNEVAGDANYLLEEIADSNKILKEALQKVVDFANDTKAAQNSGDVKAKGWGRKLKGVLDTLGGAGEQIKNISEGKDALQSMLKGIADLAHKVNLKEIGDLAANVLQNISSVL